MALPAPAGGDVHAPLRWMRCGTGAADSSPEGQSDVAHRDFRKVQSRMHDESQGDRERSEAVEAWVAAFDDEMEASGNFAAAVAVMAEHGCFDVRAVVESWVLANPLAASGGPRLLPEEPPLLHAVELESLTFDEPVPELDAEAAEEIPAPVLVSGTAPDVAHFHSLLQGGIDRAQIYEAFPAFRLVIDEAIVQYEADAPVLSGMAPSRDELNDEMRRMRQELVDSGQRKRRRWRSRG